MPEDSNTLIMKFGSSLVKDASSFKKIAYAIAKERKTNPRIVVVISAMENMTDQLIKLAHEVSDKPPSREYDMMVSVGERISIALLAMALGNLGIEAKSFTGSQSGIITSSNHSEAKILDVKPHRLLRCLDLGMIAIVAGFQGVSKEGEITTLGRGGSDTTAVAVAIATQGSGVIFYKDVPGIADRDPKKFAEANFFSNLTYDIALDIVEKTGGKILHPRAIMLAKNSGIKLTISGLDESSPQTVIYDDQQEQKKMTYEKELSSDCSCH